MVENLCLQSAFNEWMRKVLLLTVDLCDASSTLHPDSDVNAGEALLPQQQHWLQKLQGQKESPQFHSCKGLL